MVAQPIRLDDWAGDPHGKRYTPEEKEHAYGVWKWSAGRSLAKTADATGIAASTLGSWHQRDNWTGRAKTEDDELAQSVKLSIAGKITGEVVKSIETVVAIRDDTTASNRDRFLAATWIAGVGGVSPISKGELGILSQPTPEPTQPTEPEAIDTHTLTIDQLMERERERRRRRTRQE